MNGVQENLTYKSVEKTPTSFTKTRKAIGGLALSLALLSGGEIASNQSAEAQEHVPLPDDASDSEYAPDCGYGLYPYWRDDKNRDGQQGPGEEEFACLLLPGCRPVPVLPRGIANPLKDAGLITGREVADLGTRLGTEIILCPGDNPVTGIEDYVALIEKRPWAPDKIAEILANKSFWNSADMQDRLKRNESSWANHWLLGRFYTGTQAPAETGQTSTPEPTDGPEVADQTPESDSTPDTQAPAETSQTSTPEPTDGPEVADQTPESDSTPDTQAPAETSQTNTPEPTDKPEVTDQTPESDSTPDTPALAETGQTSTPEPTTEPEVADQVPESDDTPDTPALAETGQTSTPEPTTEPEVTDQTPEGDDTSGVVVLIGAAVAGLGLAGAAVTGLSIRSRRIRRRSQAL